MADPNPLSMVPPQGPNPMIGRVIADRFEVLSLIARGGMGRVYRAEQKPLGRICAIKIVNAGFNTSVDPEFHRRFFLEASVSSKFTHPNTVTVFDYGRTDDDVYFMAMELLEGRTRIRHYATTVRCQQHVVCILQVRYRDRCAKHMVSGLFIEISNPLMCFWSRTATNAILRKCWILVW
jgi:serine/threonine protein kinase